MARTLVTLFFALALVGCGSDSEGPTCPVNPHPYDGYWMGRTSEGQEVQARILNSVIVHFRAAVRVSANCSMILGYNEFPATAIVNREFHAVSPASWGMSAFQVDGRFDADRRLSGNISAMRVEGGLCGLTAPADIAALTFTAEQ